MSKTRKKPDAKHPSTPTADKPGEAADNPRELTDAELDKVAGGVGIVSRRGLDDKLATGVAFVKRTRS
jgi:hypothetical protein